MAATHSIQQGQEFIRVRLSSVALGVPGIGRNRRRGDAGDWRADTTHRTSLPYLQ